MGCLCPAANLRPFQDTRSTLSYLNCPKYSRDIGVPGVPAPHQRSGHVYGTHHERQARGAGPQDRDGTDPSVNLHKFVFFVFFPLFFRLADDDLAASGAVGVAGRNIVVARSASLTHAAVRPPPCSHLLARRRPAATVCAAAVVLWCVSHLHSFCLFVCTFSRLSRLLRSSYVLPSAPLPTLHTQAHTRMARRCPR